MYLYRLGWMLSCTLQSWIDERCRFEPLKCTHCFISSPSCFPSLSPSLSTFSVLSSFSLSFLSVSVTVAFTPSLRVAHKPFQERPLCTDAAIFFATSDSIRKLINTALFLNPSRLLLWRDGRVGVGCFRMEGLGGGGAGTWVG